ncbi:DUF938 domain-containing protein [Marivibrio halodurans]|uniref:DUF938 domain-containing protein n=1 Tax=Marivibrio halodurans TaxID=2039722 RepID=UPI0031BA058C
MKAPDPDAPNPRRHAPAALRNRDAILPVLTRELPTHGTVLEIASGSGEHAAHFAPILNEGLRWQPSDLDDGARASIDAHARDTGCARIAPALLVDVTRDAWWSELPGDVAAIFCANMIHIAPFAATRGLMAGAGRLLPAGAPLILYGPYRREGRHTADTNEAFDESLRERNPAWGVRDLEGEVAPEAEAAGLALAAVVPMPANNLIVVFRR